MCYYSYTLSKIGAWSCLITVWYVCPSMYYSAAKFFPKLFFITGKL